MERRVPTKEEVLAYLKEDRNWGRWGNDDQVGAVNMVTPEKRLAAAAAIKSGQAVSLSREFPKTPAPNNPNPAHHYMKMVQRSETSGFSADYYGISNWYRTANSMPAWWEAQRDALEQEMGEFDDEAFFNAKSPFFHADQIVRPLIVLQGANDPRVLQIESDQIVEAVRANGVPVDYVLFEDEGHGFVKKENQAEAARRVLAFLDDHLRATS